MPIEHGETLEALRFTARQNRGDNRALLLLADALALKGNAEHEAIYQYLLRTNAATSTFYKEVKRKYSRQKQPALSVRLEPCRILLITNLYPPQTLGGYGLLMADFVRILEQQGHTLQVLTSNTAYLGRITAQENNIQRTLNVFGRWNNDGSTALYPEAQAQTMARDNFFTVQRAVEAFQPTVCLAGDIEGLSCHIFQPLLQQSIPVVHHLGHSQPGYVVKNTPTSPLYRLATASHWLKKHIQSQGFPLKKIDVIYSAGDSENFYHPILPRFDTLKIVFAGLMEAKKGPQTLLKALFFIKQKGIDFQCTFAGGSSNDAFVERFKQGIEEAGLEQHVILTGKLEREQLRQLFVNNNVLVFPSIINETFGMSQVEAMAAGLVVIGTGTGGGDEVIEHNINGLKFPKGDAETLARYLIELSQNESLCERLAKQGQNSALTRFNVTQSTHQIETLFKTLLEERLHG